MNKFRLYNNLLGWFSFAVAATVYILTLEPTTSFWDCGEFITTSYKLEVGHPPGAPFYMILGRFFAIFAGDPSNVAASINILSALASAFTILFLFWTITHLARRFAFRTSDPSTSELISILAAGLVGSLAYTFSDTFWFSAVEAEVYALSSLFTAIVFWLILKWEDESNQKYAMRWIILAAYLMGLSIGVHLLNLLTIPALVFVFYFKKYAVSSKGVVIASLISILILGSIMYGIIPGIVRIASWFELLFINSFGLPYKTGVLVFALIFIGLIVFGLNYTYKKKRQLLNTILLAFTVIMIGYSSFTMIVIRSLANPPLDENNPEDVFALLSYLNREQYGDRPLLYGEYYNAPITAINPGVVTYRKEGGKYVKTVVRETYEFDSTFKTLFPRMYSRQSSHITGYESWGKIKGTPIQTTNQRGELETIYKPTFGENLRFFFKYQLGHMYIRYFMWNFAGRQNDQQGFGSSLQGNWISGISFIDKILVGNQKQLPEHFKNDPARNTYFLLPLILGLIGLLYQFKKDKQGFTVTGLLFFFTGIAILIYLNQTPYQPRERDYAYAGSFYAFTIWIGLGVLSIIQLLQRIIPENKAAIIGGSIALLAVPGILLAENYDDHDRSHRYLARDIAKNYLSSCEKDAILFTFGDNDTFPLWYIQEVENYRTDVRIVNMSLLSVDWYINQLRRTYYDSKPVKLSFGPEKITTGNRDQILLIDQLKTARNLKDLLQFVASDDAKSTYRINPNTSLHYLPGKKISLPVDKAKVLRNGDVSPENEQYILPAIEWEINKNSLIKNEMMMLDIIAENAWERPIYFAVSAPENSYLNLDHYLQLEGLAYRLVPIKTVNTNNTLGRIDSEELYQRLVHDFAYGNMESEKFRIDEHQRRVLQIIDLRNIFARVAMDLAVNGKNEMAIETIKKSLEVMPPDKIPFDYTALSYIKVAYIAENFDLGNQIAKDFYLKYQAELEYFESLNQPFYNIVNRDRNIAQTVLSMHNELLTSYGQNQAFRQLLELQ